VINLWDEFRKNITIKDPIDLAASVLATGRIMDLRVDVKSPEVLTEIVSNIRIELESQSTVNNDYKELAILLLAAAFIELSPKVEKYRDIVESWVELKGKLNVSNIQDIVSVILFSGKIRDMDVSTLLYPTSISDQIGLIRSALDRI
jgi:hypothetical protein